MKFSEIHSRWIKCRKIPFYDEILTTQLSNWRVYPILWSEYCGLMPLNLMALWAASVSLSFTLVILDKYAESSQVILIFVNCKKIFWLQFCVYTQTHTHICICSAATVSRAATGCVSLCVTLSATSLRYTLKCSPAVKLLLACCNQCWTWHLLAYCFYILICLSLRTRSQQDNQLADWMQVHEPYTTWHEGNIVSFKCPVLVH